MDFPTSTTTARDLHEGSVILDHGFLYRVTGTERGGADVIVHTEDPFNGSDRQWTCVRADSVFTTVTECTECGHPVFAGHFPC